MVLTRGAATAARSIIRWLPNEILSTVAQELPTADLRVLCLTSRLLRNIATPFLYRCVHLPTLSQLKCFLRTMKQRSGASLHSHVHQFYAPDKEGSGTYTPRLLKALTKMLCQLSNLHILYILFAYPAAFTELLEHGSFPRLTVFLYTVQHETATAVVSFLNRHTTITDLTLLFIERVDLPGPITMPQLVHMNIPNHCFSSFDLDGVSLEALSIVLLPFDADMTPTLPLFHAMSRLTRFTLLSAVEHLDDATELHKIIAHLSHLQKIKISRVAGNLGSITWAGAVEIAVELGKFKSLWSVELDSVLDQSCDAHKVVNLWGDACELLIAVKFEERSWRWSPDEEDWINTSSE
ncbi:hypothetical protein R3P38DRAFT_3057612 [Favolaschia claudopus]|uniref:F-box domain-containing protein n=1 Tax=Favolaschia claudopus TaxID=2862362 RepID=A0AAW0A289_9AGAR